ncbi:hypothetical protein N9V94_00210 [bacterium]|jgi:predicted negative regulator of RcsB-dependent stress response|nr:hypothetical protein [bacterium]
MSPELLETIQTSPLTPWIGAALLIFLAFTLVKIVAQTIGKLIIAAVLAIIGILGWNWWNEQEEWQLSDIGSDWFQSIQETDFSTSSVQTLVEDTSRFLKEATEASRAKGHEATKSALARMAESLKEKMTEAGNQGQEEAQREIEKLHQTVMAKLK